jgi:hypothetical protein
MIREIANKFVGRRKVLEERLHWPIQIQQILEGLNRRKEEMEYQNLAGINGEIKYKCANKFADLYSNVKGHFKADNACVENVLSALKQCHDACIMLNEDITWGRHEIYRGDKENKDMHYINLTTLDWSCAHGFIKVNLEFPVKWLGYQEAEK